MFVAIEIEIEGLDSGWRIESAWGMLSAKCFGEMVFGEDGI